jgi:hypothetical protein
MIRIGRSLRIRYSAPEPARARPRTFATPSGCYHSRRLSSALLNGLSEAKIAAQRDISTGPLSSRRREAPVGIYLH